MAESSNGGPYGWLEKQFGVKYSNLDKETRKLVAELGQSGVEDLVEAGQKEHRGTHDLIGLAERLQRIAETGGLDKWVSNGARKIHDKPADWLPEEQLEVGKKIFDEDE